MKPRTKYEKSMAAINELLKEDIAIRDAEWAKAHSYKDKKDRSTYYYFNIKETHKGMEVDRLYRIYRFTNKTNKKDPYFYVYVEIARKIGGLIFAKQRTLSFCYYDTFSYGSPIELRSDYKNYSGYCISMLWLISEGTKSKRGKRMLCSTINPSDTATFVRSCPMAETLYNAHDFMVNYLVGRGGCAQLCNSVRIARKHGYDLNEKNASRWVDTICMLRDVGRDINSPHYICPQSLEAAHALAIRMHERAMENRRGERQIAEAQTKVEENQRYIESKQKYFDLNITNGYIECHVLRSIQEFAEEGAYMHHCVYACGYYKKPCSIVFSARIDGARIETVEVDLEKMKVVQCYGRFDKPSEHHDEILKLFKSNMYQIKAIHNSQSEAA